LHHLSKQGGIAAGVVSFIRINLDVKRLISKYYTSINSSFLFKSRYLVLTILVSRDDNNITVADITQRYVRVQGNPELLHHAAHSQAYQV
jgi:hypothetical protein